MAKEPFIYSAEELFDWICNGPDFVLLDVRNEKDFSNWFVEGPCLFPYLNIPYYNFIEDVGESVAMIPAGQKVRIVCSKENSAKFVGEQLLAHGFEDVGYLKGGIVSWGNALAAKRISPQESPYSLYQCTRPGKGSCSYILHAQDEIMLFDPSRNIEFYTGFAREKGARIIKTFETHRQADYISGGPQIAKETGATILVKLEDFTGAHFDFEEVEDGREYTFVNGGPSVKAIHTPGYTMGSTSYLVDDKYLLSGDTIFITTAGRPDLGGKSEEWSRFLYLTLTLGIRDLSDEVLVCPGHYSSWDEANDEHCFVGRLGTLRKENPAFSHPTELHFAGFIKDNIRPQPAVYTEIRRVNGGWLQVKEEEADVMDLGKNECGASNYGKVGVSAEVQRTT